MKAFTINDLLANLFELKKKGLGEKRILISADDEGNGYHELFYLVNPNAREFFGGSGGALLPYGVSLEDLDDYVVLG